MVLIHFLATYTGDIILGDNVVNFQKFNIEDIINNNLKNIQLAPNIIPVLKNYYYLVEKGIININNI